MGLSSQEKFHGESTLFLKVRWYTELPPASCVPSLHWCPRSIRPFHGYASHGYLFGFSVSGFGSPLSDPLPSLPTPKTPYSHSVFLLCFTSQMCFDNCLCFSKIDPLVHVCVCVDFFVCFFPQVATHYFPWPSGKPGRLWESNFGSLERDGTCSMHQIGKWWANLKQVGK